MRLESVTIHNYRLYHDFSIEFPKLEKDVQVIVGDNGVGKTTFLNAINWCLYGYEPHSFSEEHSLPIKNLDAEEDDNVFVELVVSSDRGYKLIFKRTHGKAYNDELEVSVKDPSGETHFLSGEQADYEVEGFVPLAIREFFFFDGEQLDDYFANVRTKNIENRIFILSHIDILNQMIERLQEKRRSFNKEAGQLNEDVEPLRLKLEQKQAALDQNKELEKSIIESNIEATIRIKELDDELKGIPDVIELEEKRDELKEKVSIAEDECNNARFKINQLLLLTAPSILSYDGIDYVLNDINEKVQAKQLPPKIDVNVVNESLESNTCKLCNRTLDDESINYLINALNDFKLSSSNSQLLINLKSHLELLETDVKSYSENLKNLNDNLSSHENYLKEYTDALNLVKEQYAGYEDGDTRSKFEEREKLESDKEKNNIKLGSTQKNISNLKKEIENINKEIEKILANNEKTIIINKKKNLCSKSLDLLYKTKNDIMISTKEEIGEYTRDKFFELIWKQHTFSDVKIDDAYNVELIHNVTNSNCLGSASAAERELLALAFTLGVHSVSGFNSPLLIDTPLARVSGAHRVNFTNVLLEISKNKQTILILTPDEFSQDVRDLIYEEHIPKFGIVQKTETYSQLVEMSINQMETFIEELRRKSDAK